MVIRSAVAGGDGRGDRRRRTQTWPSVPHWRGRGARPRRRAPDRGRGRLGREWVTPPGSSLSCRSCWCRTACRPSAGRGCRCSPGSPRPRRYDGSPGVESTSSGPTTCSVDEQKLGGILVERVETGRSRRRPSSGSASTSRQSREELPVPEATSLALVAGAPSTARTLLSALLEELRQALRRRGGWRRTCARPTCPVRDARPAGAGRRTRWGGHRRGGRRSTRTAGWWSTPPTARSTSVQATSSTCGRKSDMIAAWSSRRDC